MKTLTPRLLFIALVIGCLSSAGRPQVLRAAGLELGIQFFPGLSITGTVGSVQAVQYKTNLEAAEWMHLAYLQVTNVPHLFLDTAAPPRERRFYRAVQTAPATFGELQALPEEEQRFFRAAMGLPELVLIQPGTFLMGSPGAEVGRNSDEGPQTLVTLTRAFYMGKYEVTQSEYAKVSGTNAAAFPTNPNLPMEMVSWPDAMAHCHRLNQREAAAGRLPAGWAYRLPTEAEWEYCCRAGKATRYSFGDDLTGTEIAKYAWFGEVNTGRTRPVGTKLPNPWGLYDMHGNVWELCLDAWTYTGGSATNPQGTGSGRMTRGGSWHSSAARCRAASRNPYDTVGREAWVGFRVVLAPVP